LPEVVVVSSFGIVLDGTLQLHDQAECRAIEVHNETGEDMLATEPSPATSPKAEQLPDAGLSGCRAGTEFPSAGMQCETPAT